MVTRRVCFFVVLVFLLVGIVSASSDVAYIYKSSASVDENVLDVFSKLGLSVDKINEKNLYGLDFSDYKMIFVGDERFRNEGRIPIYDKPTVIANYYHGEEFGLTDYDGVSKLAGTEPLKVKKGGKILQVYTQSEYKLGGISIPYYYLDDENKVPEAESVARTYTGGENGYDFGDVISYIGSGTKLVNGKTTRGNICFFGIIESDFWTAAARDMFKDCVGYVATACGSDLDCPNDDVGGLYCLADDVYQDVREFRCENAGTVKSECVDDLNSELVENCGESYCENFGELYCASGDVYHSRTCYDKGCSAGSCFLNSYKDEKIFDDCLGGEVCMNGKCESIACYVDADCDDSDGYTIDICENAGTPDSYCRHEELQCLSDADCDDDFYSANYCDGNSVFRDLHDFSCGAGLCNENVIPKLVEECSDVCVEGECKEIVCSLNSDCGINLFSGEKFCQNDNSYEYFNSYICRNPGKLNSYCENYSLPILIEYCDFDCVGGECYSCFNDLSCGTDGYVGSKYCVGDDSYQNYQTFLCENAGTPDSDCSSDISPRLIEKCDGACVGGECVPIECYVDADCDDLDLYSVDVCENAGTPDSYCSHTPINCINNNDCGTTGFFGDEFCSNNDLFKKYRSAVCVNANTSESYCDVSLMEKNIVDCGEDEVGEMKSYCSNDDVWMSQNSFSRGCSNASCFENVFSDEKMKEDCGEDSYGAFGDLYCVGDDVYKNRTRYDRGCAGAECFVNDSVEEKFVAHCEVGCVGGECIEPSCGDGNLDSGEECDDGNVVGGDGCDENCLAEECVVDGDCDDGLFCNGEESCVGGECVSGDAVVCDVFDLDEIASCDWDENVLTWDYFEGFDSVCSESLDSCTSGSVDVVSECDFDCGAECVVDGDCGCDEDYCDGTTLYDYVDYGLCDDCLCGNCGVEVFLNSSECGYVAPYCGDGNLDSGEECDDGNNYNDDGCDENCEIECECYNDSDCGEDYCDDWEYYCKLNSVMKKRTCYDNFCDAGECSQKSRVEKKLFEKCLFGCENGKCLGCDFNFSCDLNFSCGGGCDWNKDFFEFNCSFC
ncbi:MAG: hypothetical protein V1889_03235 [archaeon]